MKEKSPKWHTFLDPKGEVGGIEDSEGRQVVKFNYHDSPLFRAALAKNIIWVHGCIRSDMRLFKFSFRTQWKRLFEPRRKR
jgi:hypothetical protein